jgi:hypothetical protein
VVPVSEDGGGSRASIALVAVGAILVALFAIATIGGAPADTGGAMSVSQFLVARDAGTIGDAQVRVEGFWTNRSVGHSCAPPLANPGELEIYCHDGEYGITELAEPILVMTADFVVTEARGPHLTPWFEDALWRQVDAPIDAPPLPILVRGHVNDARAAQCQPAARELCADRLVVDDVLELRR